ncbi:hypothetical protein GGF50DRAFT_105774 [Schizophyllum commune]
MARQSPARDPAPYAYCFSLPLNHAPRQGDAPRDVWGNSTSAPVPTASPPLNADTLPPHPATRKWATSDGRPPMAFLEPPPPSDAVTHSAELFSRLAELQKSRVSSPASAEEEVAEGSSSSPQPPLAQPVPERAPSPRVEDLPPPDPSAHPGFSSLPFWVPPRDSPASIYYEPKAAAPPRSQEPTRDQPTAPADGGRHTEGRVAHPRSEAPSSVRVKREPEEQCLSSLLSPMSAGEVPIVKPEPREANSLVIPRPQAKRRRGEDESDVLHPSPSQPSNTFPSRSPKRRRIVPSLTPDAGYAPPLTAEVSIPPTRESTIAPPPTRDCTSPPMSRSISLPPIAALDLPPSLPPPYLPMVNWAGEWPGAGVLVAPSPRVVFPTPLAALQTTRGPLVHAPPSVAAPTSPRPLQRPASRHRKLSSPMGGRALSPPLGGRALSPPVGQVLGPMRLLL